MTITKQFTPLTGLLLLILVIATFPALNAATTLEDTPIRQARLYEKQGNYQQASDMYLLTAKLLPAQEGEKWKVKAAEMAWFAGNNVQAAKILEQIDENALDQVTLVHARLVAARIARSRGDYAGVLERLNIPTHLIPPKLQATTEAMISQARGKLGRQDAARLSATPPEPRMFPGAESLRKKWDSLISLPTQTLSQQLGQPLPPIEKGWTELAYIVKTTRDDPEALNRELTQWGETYRNHPAWPDFANALRPQTPSLVGSASINGKIERIAVLLPTSGPLSRIANVVMEGIMAARYQQPETTVRVYDSATDDIYRLYRQATDEGAQLVIGPMDKHQVDQLAREQLSVPVISLNYTLDPTLTNPQLLQFGLLPEDEARQVARRMLADGYQHVAVLTPKNAWGARILKAFEDEITRGGGDIVANADYKARSSELSNIIQRTLKPNPKTHENRIGAEAVFFAANPNSARLLMPLIKFHFITSLPAYSTSHVWSGFSDRSANRDLNRLQITEIPWLLGQAPSDAPRPEDLDAPLSHHPRLFAFGYDALATVPALLRGDINPEEVRGLSGTLTLGPDNRIHRHLSWARFSRGQIKPLLPAVPPATLSSTPKSLPAEASPVDATAKPLEAIPFNE